MRAPLQAGEDCEVDLVLDVVHDLVPLDVHTPHPLPVEDDARPGAPQGLVHSAGHHVTVLRGFFIV